MCRKCELHPDWDLIGCPECEAEHDIALIIARSIWPDVEPGRLP